MACASHSQSEWDLSRGHTLFLFGRVSLAVHTGLRDHVVLLSRGDTVHNRPTLKVYLSYAKAMHRRQLEWGARN